MNKAPAVIPASVKQTATVSLISNELIIEERLLFI
jgi:hypothetical protein